MWLLKIVSYPGSISGMTWKLNELQFPHLLKNVNNKKHTHTLSHTWVFLLTIMHPEQIIQHGLAAYGPVTGLGYENSVNKFPAPTELGLAGKTEKSIN